MEYAPWAAVVVHRVCSFLLRGDPIDFLILSILLMLTAVNLIISAIRIRWSVHKKKKTFGIPERVILYSDLNVPANALFSTRHRLTGKPDYILRKENRCIP